MAGSAEELGVPGLAVPAQVLKSRYREKLSTKQEQVSRVTRLRQSRQVSPSVRSNRSELGIAVANTGV